MPVIKKTGSISANISTLKTHLGQYIKKVKAGTDVIVLDRQLPVAKLTAFHADEDEVTVIQPTKTWSEVEQKMGENNKKMIAKKLMKNSLFYLEEDRRGR